MKPAPAQTFEEIVVALCAHLDAPEQAERGVGLHPGVDHQLVQVLHRDPPEYRPAETDGRVHSVGYSVISEGRVHSVG